MVSGRRIEYADFAVRIAPAGAGGFESEVLWAPEGRGRAPFQPPFDAVEIPALLGDLGRAIRGSGRHPPRHLEEPPDAPSRRYDPREVGIRLFTALFRDDVKTAFTLSRPRRSEPGLRIRLVIDPRQDGCAAIAALPWELLHDPDRREYLGQGPLFPIVRFLEGPGAHRPQPLAGELRVLVAICSPRELAPLDGGAERSATRRWSETPGVHVEVLEHATFDEVRARLSDEEFHVFHFSGHGALTGGHGRLAFECGDRADIIRADVLSAHLLKAPALRLAVLNACDSGKLPRGAGADPFAGVASALTWTAVPAVVAMQFPISDRAASCFAEALYASLAKGDAVDAAVSDGRLAIFRDRPSLEWATPALHLRIPDGRVFERTEPASAPPTPPSAPPTPLSPPPAAHDWLRWPAAGVLVLLAVLGWGTWRLTRPDEQDVQLPAGRSDAGSPAGGAGAPDARVAPDSVCPPHELLPGFEWIFVPAGDLELPPDEPGGMPPLLIVTEAFCIGRHEVTRGQQRSVLPDEAEPSGDEPWVDDRLPASGVSFDLAQKFVDRLNERHPNRPYRLPTGEEWEYAARAGSRAAYSFGHDAAELYLHGNCLGRGGSHDGFEDELAPVALYEPNAFGLYDVHGNVSEWVSDQEPDLGRDQRIRRGGSYKTIPETCAFASSSPVQGDFKHQDSGFRIVREPAAPYQ